ncbi:MAG: hypothetical protein ACUVRP_08340 [Chlorobiales bacterium]
MGLIQNNSGESEIGKLGSITLTDKRVYQEINMGSIKTVQIIPMTNVDSFGLISTQKVWLLILGVIIALGGLIMLVKSPGVGAAILVLAALFIAAWWFTKKVGAVVYSMSGESELFTTVPGSQLTEVVGFLNKLHTAVEAANASRKLSDVN